MAQVILDAAVRLVFPLAPLFADHFPGAPRVPGSCIVEAVRRSLEVALPSWSVHELLSARFRHFVPPASLCRLIWKQPPPLAGHAAGTDDRPAARPAVRRVGWQLVGLAPEAEGGAAGRRLAEGEVWLASAGGETICD